MKRRRMKSDFPPYHQYRPVIFPVIRAASPPPGADTPPRIRNRALSRLARTALGDSERLLAQTHSPRKRTPYPLAEKLAAGGLPKSPEGTPLPVDGTHWSLSHKPAHAGGLAAPFPVGLDIEALRPRHPRLLDKITLAGERACFASAEPASGPDRSGEEELIRLFRVWTAKEAVLKLTGKGLPGLDDCRVIHVLDDRLMRLRHAGGEFQVRQIQFDGHMAAVAVRSCEPDRRTAIRWTILPPPKA
ncbi:MAG: hypothetical protein CSB33_01360 [Desulfobacterales bacterium]|nr:MAG: hypothetical protein CSB33_01360 [Desulfobacterales bacterium]